MQMEKDRLRTCVRLRRTHLAEQEKGGHLIDRQLKETKEAGEKIWRSNTNTHFSAG